MATYTEHYNLIKPALNDKVNINNLNDNADIIDAALNNKVDTDDTQNITTSASNCMMSDGVTSVEARIDANTKGSIVDISDYSSASNLYTCPCDGYMKLIADVAVGNQTNLRFADAVSLAVAEVAINNHAVVETVYVKKGMQFYVTRSESTYSKVLFIPLS